MFGLGFSEMVMIAVVLLVVVGPKELPKLLRALGGGINKLRRMSSDLRQQSRIDEILQDEGLREDLETLRSLRGLSRGRIVDTLVNQASQQARPRTQALPSSAEDDDALSPIELEGEPPDEASEYPAIGPDCYGALAEDDPYAGIEPIADAEDVPEAERANDSDDSQPAENTEDAPSADPNTIEEGAPS